MGKLSIYIDNVHANGNWTGSFHSDIEFIPSNWGHMPTKIAQVTYITGSGSPYQDPIGDIADGTNAGGNSQLVVWLRGGATYQWSTTYNSRVTLQDGNAAGTPKINGSGAMLAVLTTQSQLVVKAKNNKYFQSVGLSTDGKGYFGGNVGIGCDPGSSTLKVYKADLPQFDLASSIGRINMGLATCANCFATGAKVGDGVIRTLGASHNLIFSIPNNNNDGNSYTGFQDEANGVWCKFTNNRMLRVNGTIVATEINVQANVWADKVFDSKYKLKSLSEIETYINTNKHLPDVPSESEVKENGINIAQMNAILLQKVEELTLLMIEQNNTIKNLQNKVSEFKK